MSNTNSTFYVTTPIYYVNDKPHIGHAYTTILADVLSRYHRLLEVPTFFLTGTDEHGQKVAQAAEKNGITPLEQCDRTVVRFQELWKKLEITNDQFIRTTEDRHKKVVAAILQDLYDRGEIYKADYQGWYCVPCERFYTEKDLVAEKCPECGRVVDKIVEANYFFRMSRYQQWLIDYISENPEFIQPAHRRNETLGFLRKPLSDLCISRPKSRLPWGIEIPFDTDYVCYVWFDALINYISAIGYGVDEAGFNRWWPVSCHLIGKDILTTHSVYWPTMLRAVGIPMPKTIFAHGWWLVGRDKMGKSLGNVVDPMAMCDKYGVDAFRYFLVAEMTLGNDASFTEEAFIDRYNADLADNLGNMLNRVIRMLIQHFNGVLPQAHTVHAEDQELQTMFESAMAGLQSYIDDMKLDRGLESIMACLRECNRYFEKTTPWELAKKGDVDRLATVLYTAAEALRVVSAALFPVMPAKMREVRRVLGIDPKNLEPHINEAALWNVLTPGTKVSDIQSLFPKIHKTKVNRQKTNETGRTAVKERRKQMEKSSEAAELIDIGYLKHVRLKTATVLSAEKIEGTTKLLKLQVQVGNESRQIIAGIAESYTPDAVVGKTIVIVANLKSARIRGIDSNGMLLAAKNGNGFRLITVDGDCPSGLDVG